MPRRGHWAPLPLYILRFQRHTHNFESVKLAAAKDKELGILRKGGGGLQFAQQKGMADSLSLGLVKTRFEVRKYVHFGPVEKVIPFLMRRDEENRRMLATGFQDIQRIRQANLNSNFVDLQSHVVRDLNPIIHSSSGQSS